MRSSRSCSRECWKDEEETGVATKKQHLEEVEGIDEQHVSYFGCDLFRGEKEHRRYSGSRTCWQGKEETLQGGKAEDAAAVAEESTDVAENEAAMAKIETGALSQWQEQEAEIDEQRATFRKKALLTLRKEATHDELAADLREVAYVDHGGLQLESLNPQLLYEDISEGIQLDADGKLISWNLRCKPITQLPDNLGCAEVEELHSLIALDLSGDFSYPINLQSLPPSIGICTALQKLDLSFCRALKSLPEGISGCVALQQLYLSRCFNLQSLPEGISGCAALEELKLRSCYSLTWLPEGVCQCTHLQTLDLRMCKALASLPAGFFDLDLRDLDLGYCCPLVIAKTLEMISCFPSITALDLRGCDISELPEDIGQCKALVKLNLWNCQSLTSLGEGLIGCTPLRDLILVNCSALAELPVGDF